MGTETDIGCLDLTPIASPLVKLINPLMGTETYLHNVSYKNKYRMHVKKIIP